MNVATHGGSGVRRSWLALLAFALSLALYLATAPPWLTWAHSGADGGDLIAAAMTGGVPHPSGYPTYCLLGRAFALLPLGSVARRFALFSATAAAASAALLSLLLTNLLPPGGGRRGADLVVLGAALVWAAGPLLWSQAIIAEVYALHAFWCALAFYLASRKTALERPRAWLGLGLALGLGLGNHLTLSLLLPPLALWLWRLARPRRVAALVGGLALGLAVYLYVPLAAQGDPPVSWGDARDWAGFWWLVSGQLYRRYLFAVPLAELPGRLAAWAALWREQLTLPGLAVALLGLEAAWREGRSAWPAAGLAAVALFSAYAIGYHTADSHVYLLPAILVGVTWLAEGCSYLGARLATLGRCVPVAAWLAPALLALWLVGANYARLDLRADHEAATWAQAVLEAAPHGALLVSGDDRHTFTLDYLRWVEGRRADLLSVDAELLPYAWYRRQLANRHPTLQGQVPDRLPVLVSEALRRGPVYLTTYRAELARRYRLEPAGPLWRLSPP